MNMAIILPFLHFFSAITYLYLAGYVIFANPKSLLNRTCAAVFIPFSLWSFSLIFIHNPYATKNIARLFYNIGAFGWTSFAGFALWFVLVFVENKKALRSKLLYPVLFVFPSILIYKQWTGAVAADYIKQPWGWAYVWADSIWAYLFYVYYLIYTGTAYWLLLNLIIKTEELIKKKQATIILSTTFATFLMASLVDVILPRLNIHIIPNIAPFFVIAWAGGLTYSIVKYKMMMITPALAADNIISEMADSLILLNEKERIAFINKATSDLLGYTKKELEGETIEVLFPDDIKSIQSDSIGKKGVSGKYDFVLKAKSGNNIPVFFTRSSIRGTAGELLGTVCLARDITQRKVAEEALKTARDELEIRVEERTARLKQLNVQLQKEIMERKQTEETLLKEKYFSELVIDSLPGIFYIFDYKGTPLRWNKHALEIIGYTAEEVRKMKMTDFLAPDETMAVLKAVRDVFVKGKATIEANVITKTGDRILYFLTGYFIKIDNKKCLLGIGMDIAERKKLEEETKKHLHELEVFYKANIGREERVMELKKRIKELEAKLGKKPHNE